MKTKKLKKKARQTNTHVFISMVNEKTRAAKRRLDSMRAEALRLVEDQAAEERIRKCMCQACYYGAARGYMVGHAFTRWKCAICFAVHEHPNTRAPVLCAACASLHALCSTCGADMDMEIRTKEYKRKLL